MTLDLKSIQDRLYEAMASDLEHGVAWLNDRASKEFASTYPQLCEAISEIMLTEDESEDV